MPAIWNMALLKRPIVPQLFIPLLAFMKPDDSLPCLQATVTDPYPESDQSTPSHHTISFGFILILLFHLQDVAFIFKIFRPKFCTHFLPVPCVLQILPISFWT